MNLHRSYMPLKERFALRSSYLSVRAQSTEQTKFVIVNFEEKKKGSPKLYQNEN